MYRRFFATSALALCLSASASLAGPFRDSEAAIAQAYADYRVALFQTNQKNKEATTEAILSFRSKWSALVLAWRASPPPQYAEDPKLSETLDAVARIAGEAATATDSGDLPRAHEILEGIRDQLGGLRSRNSITTFSDRMNAYHEVMEHAVDMTDVSQASALEHAGVLVYLAKQIGANRPSGVDPAAFEAAFTALEGSVSAFLAAARSGDKAAIDTARKALKPPYSRMFLRFG
jgi:hypothetical protein